MLRAKPEAIRAPAGFTDRVMARVTAADPRPVPAWLLAASDPVAAVGLTIALVLALLGSWWPERLLGGAALVEAWLWNGATDIARDLDPAILLQMIQFSPSPGFEQELIDDLLRKRNRHLVEELRSRLGQLRGEGIRESKGRAAIHNRLVVESLISAVNCVRRAEQSAQGSLNEPSVAASNNRLSICKRPPCEANPRTEVGLLRITQALRYSQL